MQCEGSKIHLLSQPVLQVARLWQENLLVACCGLLYVCAFVGVGGTNALCLVRSKSKEAVMHNLPDNDRPSGIMFAHSDVCVQ